MNTTDDLSQFPDPAVDEVRQIRQTLAQQFNGDVDRLCEHLILVGNDYLARRGAFAGVTSQAAAEVAARWGAEVHENDDALIDEVRELRKKLRDAGAAG